MPLEYPGAYEKVTESEKFLTEQVELCQYTLQICYVFAHGTLAIAYPDY